MEGRGQKTFARNERGRGKEKRKKRAIRGGNGEGSRKKRGGDAQQTSVLFLELMAKVYINNTHNSFEYAPAIRLRNLIDLGKGEKLGKSFWKDADRKPSRETNGEEERKKGKRGRSEVETERDLGRSAEETIQEDRDERRDW